MMKRAENDNKAFSFFLSSCRRVAKFIVCLYKVYVDLFFTYLEVNPLVITKDAIYILDLAAKVTSSARDTRLIFKG